jgi:polysaccharide export outer membrane protein
MDSIPNTKGVVHIVTSEPFVRTALQYDRIADVSGTSVAVPMLESDRVAPPLSPGDRIRVQVHDGEDFNGLYEVDIDGTLNLPHLEPFLIAGLQVHEAEALVRQTLLQAGYYLPFQLRLNLDVQQWAPVQVTVSGAVFAPGVVTVNARNAEDRAQKSTQITGDFPPERLLPAALRAAGGVRPDADLSNVLLIRRDEMRRISLAGIFDGGIVQNLALAAGDTVLVPETGRFDERLVRPTVVTTPGIRVYLSNLTEPATGNAESAIGKHATSLPYGARLLNGLIAANCVGGTGATNSSRYAVLVSRNTSTSAPMVIERSIDDLVREPARRELNPLLMPEDGIACFDSGVTNLRDVARTIGTLLLPLSIL